LIIKGKAFLKIFCSLNLRKIFKFIICEDCMNRKRFVIFIIFSFFLIRLGNGSVPNHTFYIDINNIGGECDDNNLGTIDEPWCSIERAFDISKEPHIRGGDKLYLREGIYRITKPIYLQE